MSDARMHLKFAQVLVRAVKNCMISNMRLHACNWRHASAADTCRPASDSMQQQLCICMHASADMQLEACICRQAPADLHLIACSSTASADMRLQTCLYLQSCNPTCIYLHPFSQSMKILHVFSIFRAIDIRPNAHPTGFLHP